MSHTQHNNRIIPTAIASVLVLFCVLFQTGVLAQSAEEAKAAENDKVAKNKVKSKSTQKEKMKAGGVKELSGISIIGNKEAPKSLYIVPWKNSEVGIRSSLTSGLLDGSMRPIDKEVFIRELDFYELSHSK